MDIIVLLLSLTSYVVTFMLGYGVRSYLSSHRRRTQ
jgi:hypothetical protein